MQKRCRRCSCLINNKLVCQTCGKNHNRSSITDGLCDDCAAHDVVLKPFCVACGKPLPMTKYRFKQQGNYCKECCKKAEEVSRTICQY